MRDNQRDYSKNPHYENNLQSGSIDSLSSIIHTWYKNCPSRLRPTVIVPIGPIGREVQFKSFFILFIAFLLLATGIGLTVTSIWSLIHKIQFAYLFSQYYSNLGYFSAAGGIICIPCFLIAVALSNDDKNNILFTLLFSFLVISIGVLILSTLLGLKYKGKMSLNKKNIRNNEVVVSFDYDFTEKSKEELFNSLELARNNVSVYAKAWNDLQTKMRCCGVESYKNWKNDTLPKSCCINNVTPCITKNVFKEGCLDMLLFDVYWDVSFLVGINCILLSFELVSVIYLAMIFLISRGVFGSRK